MQISLSLKAKLYEEIGYGCTGIGTSLMVNELAQIPLRLAGSEKLKQKYLTKMIENPLLAVL